MDILFVVPKEAWRLLWFPLNNYEGLRRRFGFTNREMRKKWLSSPTLDEASATDTLYEGITDFANEIEAGGDMDNFVEVVRSIADSVVGVRVGFYPILLINS